jgi:hypothetical protein
VGLGLMLVPARILRGTRGLISAAFTGADGGPPATDPDIATVRLVDDLGVEVIASTDADDADGAGGFSYTVAAAHTASLAAWSATWSAAVDGETQSIDTPVEVVGGFLFDIPTVRGMGITADRYSDATVAAARTLVESELEDACKRAFVPRYVRDVLSGDGSTTLLLPQRLASAVTAVTVDGVALTSDELAELVLDPDTGELYRPLGWSKGRRNIAVRYVHGHQRPPAAAVRAGQDLIKDVLTYPTAPIDPRASLISNDLGTLSLVTAGIRGAMFSLPSCNALVDAYALPSFG